MTAALLGLALIVLIAVVTVALGSLTRLLAARIVAPREERDGRARDLSLAERIALGDALIARDLRPDETHPVARLAPHDGEIPDVPEAVARRDLAVQFPTIASHALR